MVDTNDKSLSKSLRYYLLLDKWGLYETSDIIFTLVPIFDENGQLKLKNRFWMN